MRSTFIQKKISNVLRDLIFLSRIIMVDNYLIIFSKTLVQVWESLKSFFALHLCTYILTTLNYSLSIDKICVGITYVVMVPVIKCELLSDVRREGGQLEGVHDCMRNIISFDNRDHFANNNWKVHLTETYRYSTQLAKKENRNYILLHECIELKL